jgi:hypothetical protein
VLGRVVLLGPEDGADLKDLLEPCRHHHLLVELRRLRQGIETPGVDPAGNEVVAGSLGGGPDEHRRLDFPESFPVQVAPGFKREPVAQPESPLERRMYLFVQALLG